MASQLINSNVQVTASIISSSGVESGNHSNNDSLNVQPGLEGKATSNESGIKNIQIQIKEVPGATAYVQQFPTKALSNIGTSVQFEIVSPLASVIIPNNMFHTGELSSEEVGLRIGKGDVSKLDKEILEQIGNRPVIDISLQAGDKTISWSNPDAPVRVSIPYSPNAEELLNPEHIVVWYLSDEARSFRYQTAGMM